MDLHPLEGFCWRAAHSSKTDKSVWESLRDSRLIECGVDALCDVNDLYAEERKEKIQGRTKGDESIRYSRDLFNDAKGKNDLKTIMVLAECKNLGSRGALVLS